MSQPLPHAVTPPKGGSLARVFSQLGWIGFWIQVVFGSLPILLMIYYFTFSSNVSVVRSGFPFIEYLALANLLILLFTLYWSYGYTMVARKIADPVRRPAETAVVRTVWIGIIASTAGMLTSSIVLLIEAGHLLFAFLKAPQGGIPTIQTGGVNAEHLVSSIDMVSLMALILTLFAELLVLIFSLRLLFRTSYRSEEYPQLAETTSGVPQLGPQTKPI
jgi:hypothetical protein